MNPLLNDYYAREKNAMALYADTVKAAQGNAAMGANPLAPKLTATPGGNRPYAEMPGGSGSLANRPARPVGRSINDPQRATEMAARQLRSRGDLPGAARLLQNGALLNDRLGGLPPLPPMVPAAPAPLPALPSGKLVPGRSAVSMVWQKDPPMTPPTLDATSGQPVRSQPVPMGASPIQPAQPPTEEPVNPFAMTPLGGYVNPQAGMVPAGFNAMNQLLATDPAGLPGLPMPPPGLYGPEAPPMLSSAPIPGTDQVMPMVMGQPKGTPVARSQPKPQAEWQAPKMYDETIPEVRDGQGNVKSPARTRQYYFVPDPKTGKPMKEYALDANGDGVPDNQQPGWMSWLQGQK